MRYLVINGTGYGLGETLWEAIEAYRNAVRPGAQIECWTVAIAPCGDEWKQSLGGFATRWGGVPTGFELDLR